MNLLDHDLIKFDTHLPVHNWYYPAHTKRISGDPVALFKRPDLGGATARALYFHIPFCDTICLFCPFTRGRYGKREIIDAYLDALIEEIRFKADFAALTRVPINAIFIGGGSPSVMSVEQIVRLGAAIRDSFDLALLAEFSFEWEAKSVTDEKLAAARSIGVTHARFGLQTFDAEYREHFNLTATPDDLARCLDLMPRHFDRCSFDVLYGMNGQSVDAFVTDVESAVRTPFDLIDFYPVNDVVSQTKLHRRYERAGLPPTAGRTKFWMNLLLNELLRDQGFAPHNGHGWIRLQAGHNDNRVVTDRYSFRYHEHVYGYADLDLLGFGNGAISSLRGLSVTNGSSRDAYIAAFRDGRHCAVEAGSHSRSADATKPVATRLPYHGELDKARVDWDEVHPATMCALADATAAGLVVDDGATLRVTTIGWSWYVNLMYFLSPPEEQRAILAYILRQTRGGKRNLGSIEAKLDEPVPARHRAGEPRSIAPSLSSSV
ncbi:MAG: anaerobilin synthase [Acidimicrobiaceae bacterium]|jgi:oxygen-independent coproporphyrinogen-3 oxidase